VSRLLITIVLCFLLVPTLTFAECVEEDVKASDIQPFRVKYVQLSDYSLAAGGMKRLSAYLQVSELWVQCHEGQYRAVIMFWNEHHQKWMLSSVVELNEDNQFQPDSMRWLITLTDDGFLTWEEVKVSD